MDHLEAKWWRLAKLPAKYGGLGLRSGLSTLGAQHTVSLVKCSQGIKTFVPNFNPTELIQQETKQWLSEHLDNADIDIARLMDRIRGNPAKPSDQPNSTQASKDSLAQLCELFEEKQDFTSAPTPANTTTR